MNNSFQINLTTNNGRFTFFYTVFKKHLATVAFYLGVVALASIANAIIPYFTKLQIDTLEQKTSPLPFLSSDPLIVLLILLLVPALIELVRYSVLMILELRMWSLLEVRLRRTNEQLIWDRLKQLDAGFFQSERNKKLLYDVISSSNVVTGLFRFVTMRTSSIFTFIAIIPLLGFVSKELLALILITAFFQYLITRKLNSLREGYTFIERRTSEKTWKIRDILENEFFKLKSMGAIDRFTDEFYGMLMKGENLNYKREKTNAFYRSFSWFFESFLLIGANIFVGYQVIYGDMSIGTFTLVVSYTSQINSFFRSMIDSTEDWRAMSVSLTKLHFFFNLKSRIRTTDNPIPVAQEVKSLALKNVSFAYPDHFKEEKEYIEYMLKEKKMQIQRDKDEYNRDQIEELEKILSSTEVSKEVLDNISLTVEKGKIIALVGRNGSGKTTITHLLQHHYEPNEGIVELDTVPLFKYNQDELINLFSWLQQDPFVLERYSIRDNLLLGSTGSKDELEKRLQKTIDNVTLSEFIKTLPKGLDSVIGEDTSLSGGQRQLIAIARALIQDRPFIIFDEGSSQLDVEKEYILLKELSKLKDKKGILFITHRMSVASKADYIYVIDKGRIVESGTHRGLIEKKGTYATFWRMQTEFEVAEI